MAAHGRKAEPGLPAKSSEKGAIWQLSANSL
jgi:hypothetical protein